MATDRDSTTGGDDLFRRHRSLVLVAAAGLPALACVLIAPFRASVENTNAALVLVLLVVAVASTGLRAAGLVAALSAALSFDFFLTAPFFRLAITDRSDVETAVLLVLVGTAVTEVALWGRRQQGRASSQQGYLNGVLQAVSSAAAGVDPAELSGVVAEQLRDVLDLDASVFTLDFGPATSTRLDQDGGVSRDGRPVDVDRQGLPTDTEIELLVQSAGVVQGRYLLTAATRIRQPTLEQRRSPSAAGEVTIELSPGGTGDDPAVAAGADTATMGGHRN